MKRTTEILRVLSKDGITLEGKLDLPQGQQADKLVIFVNGSGPNTYDNRRDKGDGTQFLFYDLFAQEFCKRGAAFFRYSTRGCFPSEEAPFYCRIDETAYQTYCPNTSVLDLEQWGNFLLEDKRLKGAKIYLLGWSEGTMIAPLVAIRGNLKVSALLLAGYANDKMEEVLDWQQSGESDLVFYRQYFDYDGDGKISREEYEQDRFGLRSFLGNPRFEDLDKNSDGFLDVSDFADLNRDTKQAVFSAIERGDDDWLRENYPVRLTTNWFYGHRKLAPNRETLLSVEQPIHIFHGEFDANVPVSGARAICEAFEAAGKKNLTLHIYPSAAHTLNYEKFLYTGEPSRELSDIFNAVTLC